MSEVLKYKRTPQENSKTHPSQQTRPFPKEPAQKSSLDFTNVQHGFDRDTDAAALVTRSRNMSLRQVNGEGRQLLREEAGIETISQSGKAHSIGLYITKLLGAS